MEAIEFSDHITDQMGKLRSNALKFTKNLDDADDLVQETLIKAFRFSNNFKEGTNFKGWLFMIMRNTFINSYRKVAKSRALISSSDDLPDRSMLFGAVANESSGKLMIEDIEKALDLLPESYRYPFIAYFEGYKYNEIAAQLDLPLGTVKTHIHMARILLRKYLKNYREKYINSEFS